MGTRIGGKPGHTVVAWLNIGVDSPFTILPSRSDRYGHRHPKLGFPVSRHHPDHRLSFLSLETPGPEPVPYDASVSEYAVLGAGLLVGA